MSGAKKKEKWIQSAIKEPGDLRRKAKKAGAVTKAGTIQVSWLKEQAKKGSTETARQARLALKLREMHKK